MTAVLEVLIGPPCAGKSTWCQVAASGVILTADDVRTTGARGRQTLDRLWIEARHILASGCSVTIDACSAAPDRRASWLRLAVDMGARSRLVVHEVDLPTAQARNGARPAGERVPWALLRRHVTEWPATLAQARTEPWNEIVDAAEARDTDW